MVNSTNQAIRRVSVMRAGRHWWEQIRREWEFMGGDRKQELRTGAGNGRRRLLKMAEASRFVGVHKNTMRRWSNIGLVKAHRLGPRGDRRYRIEDLNTLISELTGMMDIGDDGNARANIISIGEASRHLDVHPNTLRRWSDLGLVRARRVGPSKRRLFTSEDIDALLITGKPRLR